MEKEDHKSRINYDDLDNCIKTLLEKRGFDTQEKALKYLYPDKDDLTTPYALCGIEEAKNSILDTISQNKRILVFGDYDCDGICAAAILYKCLKSLDAIVDVFIPVRAEDGYGLSLNAIDRAVEVYSPNLIITVDCGISSYKEIDYLRTLGIDIIVTDHHQPCQILPKCIIVNPALQQEYPQLSGAGVAFKLCQALTSLEFAMNYIDIAGISTIGDLVPLVGENRVIARLGLERLNRVPNAAINAMIRASGRDDKSEIDSYTVAYRIAPRLNAAGRLSNAEKAFKLLVSDDPRQIKQLAEQLEQENKTRQDLCKKTTEDCLRMLKDYDLVKNKIIILHNNDWEEGVVGIAASQMAQEFKRPVVLFALNDVLKGSARSITGINIHKMFGDLSQHIIKYGGHSMAAGLSIQEDKLEEFTEAANNYIRDGLDDDLFIPKEHFDLEISLDEVTLDFIEQLRLFEPYGQANHKPCFKSVINGIDFKRMSTTNHAYSMYNQTIKIVAFNFWKRGGILRSHTPKNIYYTLTKDTFNGRVYIDAMLNDVWFADIDPPNEELLFSYACKHLIPKGQLCQSIEDGVVKNGFGNVKIAFSKKTFNQLKEQFPSYRLQYKTIECCNPINTILLSPIDCVDAFSYYNLIEVYDSPPNDYVEMLKRIHKKKVVAYDNLVDFDVRLDLSLDGLRNTYTILKKLDGEKRDYDNIYFRFKDNGYNHSKKCLMVELGIFCQLGLLWFNEKGAIKVENIKTEITKSKLFMMVTRNE